LDKALTAIKFPLEFSRAQRSLNLKNLFKANEFKNFIFYSCIILKDFLSPLYFNHLLYYVIFLRLLCQEKVEKDDILISYYLIEKFINDFELLYGKENMTYNLHSHIHLPLQVTKLGPLNKHSGFSFEGASQISKNFLALQNTLFFDRFYILEGLENRILSYFVNKYCDKQRIVIGLDKDFDYFQGIESDNLDANDIFFMNTFYLNHQTVKSSNYLKIQFRSNFFNFFF
jgi:hypothetical protein